MSGQPCRRAVLCLLFALLLSEIRTNGQTIAKHPVALDDLAETAMADSLQLSPDGSMLAYSFGHWSTYLTEGPVASESFMDGIEDLPVQERTR